MEQFLTPAGIVGILLLLLLREVRALLQWLNVRNGKGNGNCALSKVCEMRHESLRELIKHVNDNLTAQSVLLREVAADVKVLKGQAG
jgi:hypothetical protein